MISYRINALYQLLSYDAAAVQDFFGRVTDFKTCKINGNHANLQLNHAACRLDKTAVMEAVRSLLLRIGAWKGNCESRREVDESPRKPPSWMLNMLNMLNRSSWIFMLQTASAPARPALRRQPTKVRAKGKEYLHFLSFLSSVLDKSPSREGICWICCMPLIYPCHEQIHAYIGCILNVPVPPENLSKMTSWMNCHSIAPAESIWFLPFMISQKNFPHLRGLLLVPFGMSSFHETSLLFLDHFWLRCWSQFFQPRIGTGVLSSSALATLKESVAAFCKALAVDVTSLGISWNSQRDPMVK